MNDPPPGPSLADVGRRVSKPWLMDWLASPRKVRADSHMPNLFVDNRAGFVERWIITESLVGGGSKNSDDAPAGDHRQGRLTFVSLGCAVCHIVPDRKDQPDHGQTPLTGLGDRMSATDIVRFLGNPHSRYPDGRMPRLPVTPTEARDIAAYLLLWSKPTELPAVEAPTPKELQDFYRKLGVRDQAAAATKLLSDKGCTACHTGLGESRPRDVPIKNPSKAGCFGSDTGVRYPAFDFLSPWNADIQVYLQDFATKEKHPSPFSDRQHRLERAGCVKCHQRDTDRPPPIEEIGSTLGGAFLQEIPFLRTPRLTNPHQKFTRVSPRDVGARGCVGTALVALQLTACPRSARRPTNSCRRSRRPTANCRRKPIRRPSRSPTRRSARCTARGWRVSRGMPARRATSGTASCSARPTRSRPAPT